MVNSSSVPSEKSYQHFRRTPSLPYDYNGHYQGEHHHQMDWPASSYPYQQLGVVPDISDIDHSNGFQIVDFVQDLHGILQCRYCILSPPVEKLPGSTSHNSSAPLQLLERSILNYIRLQLDTRMLPIVWTDHLIVENPFQIITIITIYGHFITTHSNCWK